MKYAAEKIEIAKLLQAKINALQGLGKASSEAAITDLAPFTAAFPGNTFPTGTIHEFISYEAGSAASTNGFISAITGKLSKGSGLCLWVSKEKNIFPSGLKHFGLEPDRMIFVTVPRPKDALWVMEEALKCEFLAAVIGEIKELGFTDSRRLQLAVERSGVTGFIHRYCPSGENAVACTSRWKIKPIPSINQDNLPGVGHSNWDIQLIKVRNGRPHSWHISWSGGGFTLFADEKYTELSEINQNTG